MTRDEIDNLELGDKIARKGDIIEIKGNYQYRALTQGNPIQKFWHYSKILAIEKFLPPSAGEKIMSKKNISDVNYIVGGEYLYRWYI